VQSRTVRLDAAGIDPFALGARSGLLWSRDRFALAGLGIAKTITYHRPHASGASAAHLELASLAGPDDVSVPGSGPVAFAALPFDRHADGHLIIPEIVVGRNTDGQRWLTIIGDMSAEDALDRIGQTLSRPVPFHPEPTSYELTTACRPETWRDDIVAGAIARMRAGEFRKVVLARKVDVHTDSPVDSALLVERLKGVFPQAIIFGIDGFIGASPELLISRAGDVVRAHPLAGTAPRASDPAIDQRNAVDLLASTKNRREHAITIDWLLDTLLPYCSYVDAEPEPSIVTLANVHHLGTTVEGRLSLPAPSALELVSALHPTPAVGGDPQNLALKVIDQIEGFDRGRYAGPTGWVDGAGNGSFAVSVRVAQIASNDPTRISVYAGNGIVADSDPVSELAETRSKFQAILGALLRP
jgi:isochorismate synthase